MLSAKGVDWDRRATEARSLGLCRASVGEVEKHLAWGSGLQPCLWWGMRHGI